jgi:hypothetical protein
MTNDHHDWKNTVTGVAIPRACGYVPTTSPSISHAPPAAHATVTSQNTVTHSTPGT